MYILLYVVYCNHSPFFITFEMPGACRLKPTLGRYKTNEQKKGQKVCKGHGSFARTDDSSWSPKTNSVHPAGCGIASLACLGRIIPSQATSSEAGSQRATKFSGGDGLEPAHKRINPLEL